MSVGRAPFAQEARIIRFCPVGKLKVYRIGPLRNDARIHVWHRTCTEKEQIFIHSHVAVVVWAPLPLCCLVQERPHGPVASGAADLRSHLSLQRRPGLLCAVRPIQGATPKFVCWVQTVQWTFKSWNHIATHLNIFQNIPNISKLGPGSNRNGDQTTTMWFFRVFCPSDPGAGARCLPSFGLLGPLRHDGLPGASKSWRGHF